MSFEVSAGFDAAKGDDLGECFVTPQGYAHMTHMLASLAGGRLVVALEVIYCLDLKASCLTQERREVIILILFQYQRWLSLKSSLVSLLTCYHHW